MRDQGPTLYKALCAILLALAAPAAAQTSDIGAFSARPADKPPARPKALHDEVFVVSAPKADNEAQTVKKAYEKVKSGGVIYITQENSDLVDDGSTLLFDRPVTIDLDADLRTNFDIKGASQIAMLNASANGTCFEVDIAGRDEKNKGRRDPRFEVTLRDLEIAPNPAGAPGTCVSVKQGALFVDNTSLGVASDPFHTGVHQTGGDVVIVNGAKIYASRLGVNLEGGDFDATKSRAQILQRKDAPSNAAHKDSSCKPADRANYSIGLYASAKSADARTGPPQARGKFKIDGFEIGLCAGATGLDMISSDFSNARIGVIADGDGLQITDSRIFDNYIGVVAHRGLTLRGSRIFANEMTGLHLTSPDGEIVENDIASNRRGVVLGWDSALEQRNRRRAERRDIKYNNQRGDNPPFLHRNSIGFNGRGIGLDDDPDRTTPMSRIVDNYYIPDITTNVVGCNITAGVIAEMQRFRKFNTSRKENAERFCARDKKDDFCRMMFNKSYFKPDTGAGGDIDCGGLAWMRAWRAELLAAWAYGEFAAAGYNGPTQAAMAAALKNARNESEAKKELIELFAGARDGVGLKIPRAEIGKQVEIAFERALKDL